MRVALGGRWTDNRAFSAAVLVSLLLHGALLFSFTLKPPKSSGGFPGPLVARLVQVPAPAPAAAPSEPAPQPAKPRTEEKSRPAPLERRAPEPKPKVSRTEKKPISRESEPAAPPPPPSGQTASSMTKPSGAAVPGPLAKAAPSLAPSAEEGSLETYRMELLRMARHYKRYPRVAMDNNWEGKVVVKMVVGGNGMISGMSVVTSAGYEILDKEAIDMIRKAKPLVPIPGALRGKEFSVEIPVIYSLKDPA